MKLSKQGLAQNVFRAQAITPGELLIPKKKNEAAVSPRWLGVLIEAKARSECLAPDARREKLPRRPRRPAGPTGRARRRYDV